MENESQSFGSEYAMSAGDNAASRKTINASITSKATANEHSFREACMSGLEDITTASINDNASKAAKSQEKAVKENETKK